MPDDPNEQLPLDNIGPGAANVQPVNIEDEMRRSYLDYSMSVIIGRALPDIRDGLKPVHRRYNFASDGPRRAYYRGIQNAAGHHSTKGGGANHRFAGCDRGQL